jgi:broad specificity phosphatase PhoE
MSGAEPATGVAAARGMAIDTLQSDRPAVAAEARARPGAIVLVRHGEPALSRRVRLTSQGYVDWWAAYEDIGLLEGQVAPEGLKRTAKDAAHIFASTRPRAIETARAITGERSFIIDARFVEAPLPPPKWPDFVKLSPRWWGVVARISWILSDRHEGGETHSEARARARRTAEELVALAADGDVLVLAHGYFNHMIGDALKAMGWRLTSDQGFRYWSARRFEKR